MLEKDMLLLPGGEYLFARCWRFRNGGSACQLLLIRVEDDVCIWSYPKDRKDPYHCIVSSFSAQQTLDGNTVRVVVASEAVVPTGEEELVMNDTRWADCSLIML